MYVGNLLNSQVPHNEQCPFVCAVCKKSFKQPDALKMHLHTLLEGDHLLVVFVGNLSVILVPSRCTCSLIHCTGSLCVIYKNTLMMSSALKVWSIKFLSWYDQTFLLHVKC